MARRPEKRLNKGRRWTVAEGRSTLSAWRESGMTLAAFCREKGIPEHRLAWWRRRLADEAEGPTMEAQGGGLVEAVISGVGAEHLEKTSAVVLQLRGGERIEVGAPEHNESISGAASKTVASPLITGPSSER